MQPIVRKEYAHDEKDKCEADYGASRARAVEENDDQDAPYIDGICCEVFDVTAERDIGWEDVKEMAKVNVNLRLLHDEPRERCRRTGKVTMGYTKFCGDYGGWTVANSLTKRLGHKAGQYCEVGWSRPTLGEGFVDPISDEASKIYLFVSVLPFSQNAHFKPTLDMRERTWLRCHETAQINIAQLVLCKCLVFH